MSLNSLSLWTLLLTGSILSFVECLYQNQSELDNEFTQEDIDEALQYNSNPEIQDLDMHSFALFETQTHTPPLLQPQPQPNTQMQTQTVIMPATTPSHQNQNQMLSTAPVHTASQQVPMLLNFNTLTTGGGAVTAGTGGAVRESNRRKTHSIIEKRYRSSINDKIQELRELLNIKDPKMPKSGVLQEAIKSLKSLQEENLMLKRANQNNSTFEDLEFDKWLEQILEEILYKAELRAFIDDGGVNNGEPDGADSQVITLPAEEVLQEDVVGTESRHEPDSVTRPAHGPSSEERTHTSSVHTPAVTNPPAPGLSSQCTGGQGVKRRRLPEEDDIDDSPSTSRLRTSENNEQGFNEEGLTAEQVSFSNSERLFNLAGQPPSYREAEDIVASAQSDVVSILRNVISCQQQHIEALRHTVDFCRSCLEQVYNEFPQFQQSMSNILEEVQEHHVEQGLVVNALLLMGERLNLVQRVLTELYSHMMRRP